MNSENIIISVDVSVPVPVLMPVIVLEPEPEPYPVPTFYISKCEYIGCGLFCITCGPLLYILYIINVTIVGIFGCICTKTAGSRQQAEGIK